MKPSSKSEKLALVASVAAIALLGWSISMGWFHLSFHYTSGYDRSQILHLDWGLVESGGSVSLYDYDMHEALEQLGYWITSLTLLSSILTMGYVATWLGGRIRAGSILIGAAAMTSAIALIRYASGISDAVNENLGFPYYSLPQPLDGFFGTITTWDGYFVSYGPGSGFLTAALASSLQILAALLTVYRGPVDKYLKRWEEKDIRDL